MAVFLRVSEFCTEFNVGRTRTYELINEGAIEAVKNGRRTLITRESAETWAAALPPFVGRAK